MECILYGVGTPYVYEVYESLQRLGWQIKGLVANLQGAQRPEDLGEVVDKSALPAAWTQLPVVLPLLTPGYRKQLEQETRALGFTRFPAVVDPTAVVAGTSTVAHGVYINASATVGAQCRLARFALINRSASVGHHVVVKEYASLGPGCVICGSCEIGRGAFVGAGAVVSPRISIGANAIVGAGAVVIRDVPAHCCVVGNPAEIIKQQIKGYHDVSV